jgi:hypothetical protein
VLGHCDSGRDFLQAAQDRGEALARTTWFDALHSPRRAALVSEVATRSCEVFDRFLRLRDWLGAFPELAGRAVWAVDGHHLAHASHAARDAKDELVWVGLLYRATCDRFLNELGARATLCAKHLGRRVAQ